MEEELRVRGNERLEEGREGGTGGTGGKGWDGME